MMIGALAADPYNLIITGVGGQGNVLASRIIGNILTNKGYWVTIGETFGASQRGGSVMSHLRISAESTLSPQIPKGKAHMIVALEPTEALRVLNTYGNPDVKVITNTRPIYSVGVISGDQNYPSMNEIKEWIDKFSSTSWFIDATNEAVKMGNPIFGNIILMGALAGTKDVPIEADSFGHVLSRTMPQEKVDINLEAFKKGFAMISSIC